MKIFNKIKTYLGMLLLSVVMVFVSVGRASAQEKIQDPCQVDSICNDLFQKGRSYSQENRLEEALEAYQAAYQRLPTNGLTFNLARIFHRLQNYPEAARYYRRYLENEHVNQDGIVKARDYLAQVEPLVPADSASASLAPPQASKNATVTPQTLVESKKKPVYKRAWFWGTIVGLVAVSAITTGVLIATLPKTGPTPPEGVPLYEW